VAKYDIEVEGLTKDYGQDIRALDGVSFQVGQGEIYGFLGPNGAGKSTAVRILTTLALPSGGRATVGGFDVRSQPGEVRRVAGVALQEIGLDAVMRADELLRLQGQLFGLSRPTSIERAWELIELVGLSEAADRRVGTFSGGMRRRLDLALAMVHQPEVLFLDEPTTGLDPASRREMWAEVKRLNRQLGMTIFLTTQYLEEADTLANRVAILDQGTIRVEGTPAELKATLGSESINVAFSDDDLAERAKDVLAHLTTRIQMDRESIRLYLERAASAIPAVMEQLQLANLRPTAVTLTEPTLDDVFLRVTGQRLNE